MYQNPRGPGTLDRFHASSVATISDNHCIPFPHHRVSIFTGNMQIRRAEYFHFSLQFPPSLSLSLFRAARTAFVRFPDPLRFTDFSCWSLFFPSFLFPSRRKFLYAAKANRSGSAINHTLMIFKRSRHQSYHASVTITPPIKWSPQVYLVRTLFFIALCIALPHQIFLSVC